MNPLCNVSQKGIHSLLTHAGITISTGQISNLLIKGQDLSHVEKSEIVLAGLKSAPCQQTDDTLTRVDGVNHSCRILCSPLYTSYTTLPHKHRLSLLEVFLNGADRVFPAECGGSELGFREKVTGQVAESPGISSSGHLLG